MNQPLHTRTSKGQTLVIVAVAMVAIVAMVGLIVDVGLQWADNRGSQNGTDAAAHAGAVILMRHMSAGPASLLTDADVEAAITAMAAEVEIEIESAEYTDYLGQTIIGVDVGEGGPIPTGAQGVYVVASRVHETLLARVIGITELTVTTDAAAVAGPNAEPCPPGQECALLPITFPNTQVTCDGQNKAIPTNDGWPTDLEEDDYIIVPLCGNFPGGVGWIDWTPPAGGDSELAGEICNPDTEITLPDWFFVTQTGNTNSGPVQTCLEQWIDQPILLPLFDDMCRIDPGANDPCPEGEEPSGQQSWYHFPTYATFYLTGVYVQGSHAAECDTGNGATSCLHGRFVDTSGTGTVGQYVPPDPDDPLQPVSEFFTIQLVR
jgi:hypothetical protein